VTHERGSPARCADASRDGDSDEEAEPKLDALRTVWLSMRDEEPPERGLAALLFAARDQAAAIPLRRARWRRLLIGPRRPPILALATVAVLLGGAALVARRADQVAMPEAAVARGGSAPTAASSPPESPAGTTGTGKTASAPADTTGTGMTVRAPTAAGQESSAISSAAVKAALGAASLSTHSAAGGDPGKARPEASTISAGDSAGDSVAPRSPPPERAGLRPSKASLPTARTDDGSATTGAKPDVPPDRGSVTSPRPPQRPEAVTRDGTRRGLTRGQAGNTGDLQRRPAAEGDLKASETSTERSAAPPVEPLGEQCESAARRGDCAAVRRIMGRITQIDRDFHARMAKDAAVAKCLADRPE
jgi:hypothetical protein